MTEDDVQAQEAAVLATPLDPAAEQAWAQALATELRTQEQHLMAEWKMWRHVRKDAKMQLVQTQLADVRGCLEHLAHVLDAAPSDDVD